MTALYAGLVCWLVTTILVEGELLRPLREAAGGWVPPYELLGMADLPGFWRRPKIAYLIQCHLCTGTWVGLLLGLVVPGPLSLRLLNGLLYKAVGHLVLVVVNLACAAERRLK